MDSYQAAVYETAIGSVRISHGSPGPHVFVVGPQECTHHLTAEQAREAAAALIRVAGEIDGCDGIPTVVVHVHGLTSDEITGKIKQAIKAAAVSSPARRA